MSEPTMRIVRWWDDRVLWEGPAATVKVAIHAALAADADLTGAALTDANLTGATLRWANLRGAKHLRLPTGETWIEYLTETVPALLTAAGQSLESFAPHWDCHTWDNCPMAHAFQTTDLSGVPVLLRPRAEQFVQLFDAKQIPWPLPTREQLEAESA